MDKSNKRGVVESSQKRDTSHDDYAPASASAPVAGAFGEGRGPVPGLELDDEEARQRVEEGDDARPEKPDF
jgi:hypothetical protein